MGGSEICAKFHDQTCYHRLIYTYTCILYMCSLDRDTLNYCITSMNDCRTDWTKMPNFQKVSACPDLPA